MFTKEKAEIVSIRLNDGTEPAWKVEFRMPNSTLEINRITISVNPVRPVERGPDETKTIPEIMDDAHKQLVNGLWRFLKSAIEAAPGEGKWEKVVREVRVAAGQIDPDPDDA